MSHIRGLKAALNSTGRYRYKNPESIVDYLVIGGGVVGLSIAQRLSQQFPSKSVYLVERHSKPGQEISSRHSEVIHAGLYYPEDSWKTKLCLRGRELMYDRCAKHNIPHRKTGKLVVALDHQRSYIEGLHAKAQRLQWPPHSHLQSEGKPVLPTKLIAGDEAHVLEPDLSKNIAAALWSPETGIVDSHSLMESLEKDINESENGELVYSTQVVRVDPHAGEHVAEGHPTVKSREQGWVVQTVTGDSQESDALLARTLINASGLSANLVLNSLLPEEERIPMYYARGSYASYHGPGISYVRHLIYPCPGTRKTEHAFQSLGTHLTLDMQGKIRFGPDLDWLNPPVNAEVNPDFWQKHLIPDESRLKLMHEAVTEYLPGVTLEGFQPDYCGMRPKLVGPDGGFQDFVFRTDYPDNFAEPTAADGAHRRGRPMISLLGIESPGLTSSLAIGEMIVEDMLVRDEGHSEE
ncbi:pyridine nucleotide disulfide oxidoreductase-like protein [Panus rudis PR-1116 ss-1]|nr:pyridine nucleotide disulfide oxidoreductase-like protein [Panus rudis PR-1116 ss-1]